MGLDYVDIFYSHRADPDTPLEETMGALDTAVRQGKALYVGISSYGPELTSQAIEILRDLGTPLLIHQPSYSMLNRWIERGLLDVLGDDGRWLHRLRPLAQGLLTTKYLTASRRTPRLRTGLEFDESMLNEDNLNRVRALNEIAAGRGQTLAQMALAWTLRDPRVTSTLVGVSRLEQLEDNLKALENLDFSSDELAEIDRHAEEGHLNLWAGSAAIAPS